MSDAMQTHRQETCPMGELFIRVCSQLKCALILVEQMAIIMLACSIGKTLLNSLFFKVSYLVRTIKNRSVSPYSRESVFIRIFKRSKNTAKSTENGFLKLYFFGLLRYGKVR